MNRMDFSGVVFPGMPLLDMESRSLSHMKSVESIALTSLLNWANRDIVVRVAKYLADGKLKTAPRYLLLLEGLRRRLSRLNDRESDTDQPVRRRVVAIMPHNGRGEPWQPLITESQLNNYLTSIGYEGPAKGGSSL